MPLAFLVKHNPAKHGPLSSHLSSYKTSPESLTNLGGFSKQAAEGNVIYVVENRPQSKKITYWLGYKFVSTASIEYTPPDKWEKEFKFKNVSTPPIPANGTYFETPVLITNSRLKDWLKGCQGMTKIPDDCVKLLDAVFTSAGSDAKICA